MQESIFVMKSGDQWTQLYKTSCWNSWGAATPMRVLNKRVAVLPQTMIKMAEMTKAPVGSIHQTILALSRSKDARSVSQCNRKFLKIDQSLSRQTYPAALVKIPCECGRASQQSGRPRLAAYEDIRNR